MTRFHSQYPTSSSQGEPGDYCRAIESYLCRKNDGHLIRIVGPAFDVVSGWLTRGIPLALATQGIDRYFERYYSKGPRRRPVRIEFCEADVLDVFDEWRRSVGIAAIEEEGGEGAVASSRSVAGSLPAHLERVVARLTTLRGGEDRSLDSALDAAVQALDDMRARAKSARGDVREALLDRLREIEATLIEAVRAQCAPDVLDRLAAEAEEELRPFRGRLAADAYEQARRACIDRLLRERARLPTVSYQ